MRKSFRRNYIRRGQWAKWTHECTSIGDIGFESLTPQYTTLPITVVPGSNAASIDYPGPRKVKNFTITLNGNGIAQDTAMGIGYVLVYVPYTVNPSSPDWNGPMSLYEPSQHVISSGIFNTENNPIRIHSSMSRLLNSGDKIVLLLTNLSTTQEAVYLHGLVEFSVTQ